MSEGRQVPAPDMNPRAQSHEALKGMTDAADPAGSQAVADAWGELAAGLDEAADLFRQAMMESAEGWTGEAADGMREQLARVATWSKATAAHYKAASGAIGEQSAAADSAKSAMPPPVPYDPAQMIRDAAGSGNIADMAALPFTMYAQKQKHDAAHDQAAEIVTNRDRTFADAAGTVPAFAPPPSLTSDEGGASVVSGGSVPSQDHDSAPPPRRPSDDAVSESGPPAPGASSLVTPAASEAPSAASEAPRSSPAAPPASEPSPPASEADTPPNQAASSAIISAGTDPSSFVPGAGVTPAGVGATPGFGQAPGGFGPGGSPSPLAVTPASVTGFGPSRFAMEPGRPVHTSNAGMAGVPVGGRGEGDKDGEHKRPEYLIEPDAESMFGSDAMTSPPVIGEG